MFLFSKYSKKKTNRKNITTKSYFIQTQLQRKKNLEKQQQKIPLYDFMSIVLNTHAHTQYTQHICI